VAAGADVYQFTPQRLSLRNCSCRSWAKIEDCDGPVDHGRHHFREAARKKILWTALIAGFGFLVVFGLGLHYQLDDFKKGEMSAFLRYQILSAMLMVGLYTVDLLAVVMTILTSVDTISGELPPARSKQSPPSRWPAGKS